MDTLMKAMCIKLQKPTTLGALRKVDTNLKALCKKGNPKRC